MGNAENIGLPTKDDISQTVEGSYNSLVVLPLAIQPAILQIATPLNSDAITTQRGGRKEARSETVNQNGMATSKPGMLGSPATS